VLYTKINVHVYHARLFLDYSNIIEALAPASVFTIVLSSPIATLHTGSVWTWRIWHFLGDLAV